MRLIDAFIADLEKAYGVETLKVSIAEKWKASAPAEAHGVDVQDYFKDVRLL